jgi:hypothetical protein
MGSCISALRTKKGARYSRDLHIGKPRAALQEVEVREKKCGVGATAMLVAMLVAMLKQND